MEHFTEDKKLYPFEQVKNADTLEEARAEIYRLAHHDPLVRMVMRIAIEGDLGAEDKFTLLAYHALKDRNIAREKLYEHIVSSPPYPQFIVANSIIE